MKTQAEVERAVKLLTLLATGQVKLPVGMCKDAAQQTLTACRGLMWVLELPNPFLLDQLLLDIEAQIDGPSHNPMETVIE